MRLGPIQLPAGLSNLIGNGLNISNTITVQIRLQVGLYYGMLEAKYVDSSDPIIGQIQLLVRTTYESDSITDQYRF